MIKSAKTEMQTLLTCRDAQPSFCTRISIQRSDLNSDDRQRKQNCPNRGDRDHQPLCD